MTKRELKKIGRLIYEAGSNGVTMYALSPDRDNYVEIYLSFYERREFLLDLLKSEMERIKVELYMNVEEMKKCSDDDPCKQELQQKAKDLMVYYENLDITYKNLKKLVEGDE